MNAPFALRVDNLPERLHRRQDPGSLARDAGDFAQFLRRFAAKYPHPAGQPEDEIAIAVEGRRKLFDYCMVYLTGLAKGQDIDGDALTFERSSESLRRSRAGAPQ